jgi:hypothetical protein
MTPGGGIDSGGTWKTTSAATRSGSRLVAITRSPGELASSRWHRRAVIQCQQHPARRERGGQCLQQRLPAFLHDADGSCDASDEVGLLQVTELDEPHAVGEVAGQCREHPHGQPRLPDAASAAQRQGTGGPQQVTQLGEFALTPDEAIRFFGRIALV